jgi:hypothetical protein
MAILYMLQGVTNEAVLRLRLNPHPYFLTLHCDLHRSFTESKHFLTLKYEEEALVRHIVIAR